MSAQLVAGLIFGGIGLVAFMYGKKEAQLKTMMLGVSLMVYPYFVANPLLVWVIGVLLTALLWILRD